MRLGRRTMSVVAVLSLALAAAPVKAAEGAGTVQVVVANSRMAFHDGSQRAHYTLSCEACPPLSRSDRVDPAAQTVDLALLGLSVLRSSEPVDAFSDEQTDAVRVTVFERGDLQVTLSSVESGGFDARPVPATASDGGVIAGRDVTWNVPDAAPGEFVFSVRYDDGAAPTSTGRFVPRATVELARTSPDLLRFTGGAVRAPHPVSRTSRVILGQRTTPAYGDLSATEGDFRAATGAAGLTDTWHATHSLDAMGTYSAMVSGERRADTAARFADLAPGLKGLNVGGNIMTSWHGIGQEGKATPRTGVVIEDNRLAGFTYGLIAAGPELGEAFGDLLFDGDAVTTTGVAGTYVYSHEQEREPDGAPGTFGPLRDDALAVGTSSLWARDLRGSLHDQRSHVMGANLTWAADGDVDNRTEAAALRGEPATIQMPAGVEPFYFLAVTSALPETRFASEIAMTPTSLTVTPRVEPGGYWLRSRVDGHDTDWTNNTFLMIIGRAASAPTPAADAPAGTTFVPLGAAARVTFGDRTGARDVTTLGPGVWDLRVVAGALQAAHVRR